MNQIHLIHLVESSSRHNWLEQLIISLYNLGFSQSLVTLQPRGEINNFLTGESISVYSQKTNNRILSIIGAVKSVKNAQKTGSTNFLLVEGHIAAFVGALAGRLLNINFGLVHHQQPKYFQLLREKSPIKGLIHQSIYNFYIKRAQIVQSLSMEVTNTLLAKGCEARKIVSVGHGIDFSKFQRDLTDETPYPRLNGGFPRLLMVGRLTWEKNYFLAIESFQILRKTFPTAQLLIAGTGPLQADIESFVLKQGLSEHVFLLGWVKNIPKLMAASDALLHLSVTESYGQVYVEACLANLPIFSFSTGIAIDFHQSKDPLVHIFDSESPHEINMQIKNFFIGKEDDVKNVDTLFMKYRRHDQSIVFQEIAEYLSRMIPQFP
jgi:glycosyltransferase involved in cell wall biosynthesis